MRFDVHKVRTYLINELQDAPVVKRVAHDGTDVMIIDMANGQQVIIQVIERLMSISDIESTLKENNAAGRHTLFILWADMLLPQEKRLYIPDDWMEVLYTLYNGKIYGYDTYAQYVGVFPVYFERQPGRVERFIRYGDSVDPARLHTDYIHVQTQFFSGYFRVADFEPRQSKRESAQHAYESTPTERNSMSAFYAVLKIAQDSDKASIRAAYRRLARQHHPDLNSSPEATARMQQINEAYDRIMRQFGDEAG
ncbi:MAG: DnaJ domain-containing protein [Anaerolineae bacterium]|nr:DnaJ domain-containing protein [Anaerolineae bacterium]